MFARPGNIFVPSHSDSKICLKSECFPQLRFKAIEVSVSGVSDLFAQQLRPCGGRIQTTQHLWRNQVVRLSLRLMEMPGSRECAVVFLARPFESSLC
jgi:hypothetical protein